MKLGIMQPYFFPYIGYFQLMSVVDQWVIFDDVQFVNKGWVNRNRILHPDFQKEWQYITLPLNKRRQQDRVCEISIKDSESWRAQILGKLTPYKKKAPFYRSTIEFVEKCFNTDEVNLSKFLEHTLRVTCSHLQIDTPISVQSGMDLALKDVEHAGQWTLRISQAMGASEYINPHGGVEIYEERDFEEVGIKLSFLRPNLRPYAQERSSFVPGLSVIDVLMWNDLDVVSRMLSGDYELLTPTELKESLATQ